MSFTPAALALLVILIFIGIVLLMFRASQKDRMQKARIARQLGFEPLVDIPFELQSRVEDLYKNESRSSLEIHNLYQRKELDRSVYLFDLIGTDDEDTTLGTEILAVISKDLALPRFSLTSIPFFSRQSGIGALMDKLLDKVMDLAAKFQDLSRIEFPEVPGFDDHFVVFGRDVYAVRDLVSSISWDVLSRGKSPMQVNGSGDFLVVDHSISVSTENKEKNLADLYQVTTDLARRLER